jgi:hypothetical protein
MPSSDQPRDLRRVRSGLLGLIGISYIGFAYALAFPRVAAISGAVFRCPFLAITGIECPLCGLTRSWNAALHLDWATAFAYHSAGPVLLLLAVAYSLHNLHRFVQPSSV